MRKLIFVLVLLPIFVLCGVAVLRNDLFFSKKAESERGSLDILAVLRLGMYPEECEKLVGPFGIANVPVFRPVDSKWSKFEFWFVKPAELSNKGPEEGLQAITEDRNGEAYFIFPLDVSGQRCSGKIVVSGLNALGSGP